MNAQSLPVLVLAMAAVAVTQEPASDPAPSQGVTLQWQDGGRLRGTIAESPASDAAQLRFLAPQFAGELVVSRDVLAGIQFAGATAAQPRAVGAFRIVTSSSDVWTGDLVASDASSLTVRNERMGDVRVPRSAIRTIERCDDPAVLLDASRFAGETEQLGGPIEGLRFAVYEDFRDIMGRTREAYGIPRDARGPERIISQITDNEPDDIRLVFEGSVPQFEGSRSRGFLDLGLNPSGDFEMVAMVFDGRFETEEAGPHRFVVQATHGARLFVDGELVAEGKTTGGFDGGPALREGTIDLEPGSHDLRVVFFNYIKDEHLTVTVTDPKGNDRYLSGKNAERSWDRGPGGHARTDAKDRRLFCPVELPARFEVALELVSSASPRFLVSVGSEDQGKVPALAVETWEDLLIVTQGDLFEPLGTLPADRGEVDLVLAFDGERGQLEVFTGAGRSLGVATGVRLPAGATGLSLRNRGVDLMARRLVVRSGLRTAPRQEIDSSRPRVHLRDGRVLYGQLELRADGAAVAAVDGAVESVALADVDRVLNPAAQPRPVDGLVTLTWADGAILHGNAGAIGPEQIELSPEFADEPIACSTTGASRLTFPAATPTEPAEETHDELVTGAYALGGHLVFATGAAPLAFRPLGATDAVPLVASVEAQVRRSERDAQSAPSFDGSRFPCVLHSRAGERIPCELLAWSDGKLTIRHPFGDGAKQVDAEQCKALDLAGETLAVGSYPTTKAFGELLERALVIPRFRRKNPDDYLIVARSDDLMRGELVSILGGVLRIESKLKEQDVPLQRLKLVVNIEDQASEESAGARLTLDDGAVLVLTPDTVEDGLLRGRSIACGEVAVPIDRITDVRLGPAIAAAGERAFSAWLAKPAPEPSWDH